VDHLTRPVLGCSVLLLVCLSGILLLQNGCGGGPYNPIQHVVIIFQENRTPDNLFHDPVLIARGADIASSGVNSSGEVVALRPIGLGTSGTNPLFYDLNHSHLAFVQQCDADSAGICRMDGSDGIPPTACPPGVPGCLPPHPAYMYVEAEDVQPYFQMAEQYTFADRMFQTNQGPSFPAHQFIFSGTSAPSPGSDLFAAENPIGPGAVGCMAPPSTYVMMIAPDGQESSSQYPCFEHPTLSDLLEQGGLTWRYYTSSGGSIWTAPNAIQHICGPNAPPPNATECEGKQWAYGVTGLLPDNHAPVLTDIAAGNLPAVTWIIPTGLSSDHAGGNDGTGPSWVAAVVNAIGNSPYWSSTVIFITWDDWGGWYDHVPPPRPINQYEYGFRVPLIVLSPYAKAGYISHVQHDFGSILKFIEETFRLPSLGYADLPADNLADCFDFRRPPIQFQTISAPLDGKYFINDTRPVTDPDDD
jgi:phospholipase C